MDALVEAIMVFTFQVIQSQIISATAHFYYMTFVGALGMSMTFSTFFFEYRRNNKSLKQFPREDLPLITVRKEITPDRRTEEISL